MFDRVLNTPLAALLLPISKDPSEYASRIEEIKATFKK